MSSHYMYKCFDLALQARGQVAPNPYVGCVIVKNDQVIAEGFHRGPGLDHAEKDALKNCSETDLTDATLYCNLEPCCHTSKRTPPCVPTIIDSGIKKVVIANLDPNPAVAGKGVEQLRAHGIEVITGILAEEGELLNEVFFTNMRYKRPFIHLKWAQTLDGKTATLSGSSKWITSKKLRNRVHRERSLYQSILVGKKTVLKDNPSLTTRLATESCPTRLILWGDSTEVPPGLKVFTDQYKDRTTLLLRNKIDYNCHQITYSHLSELLEKIYLMGITSIYIEGGMHTLGQFVEQKLFDRISIYTAPKLLGAGITLVNPVFENISNALHFADPKIHVKDNHVIFESRRNLCLQD